MVYVQRFGLWNGQDHEAVLINNYVRVGGGTIFFWESDNSNKAFPVIWLDLWKILCFRSNLFRRKMFDYNRPAPNLLKPVPQRQALLVVQFYLQQVNSPRCWACSRWLWKGVGDILQPSRPIVRISYVITQNITVTKFKPLYQHRCGYKVALFCCFD